MQRREETGRCVVRGDPWARLHRCLPTAWIEETGSELQTGVVFLLNSPSRHQRQKGTRSGRHLNQLFLLCGINGSSGLCSPPTTPAPAGSPWGRARVTPERRAGGAGLQVVHAHRHGLAHRLRLQPEGSSLPALCRTACHSARRTCSSPLSVPACWHRPTCQNHL